MPRIKNRKVVFYVVLNLMKLINLKNIKQKNFKKIKKALKNDNYKHLKYMKYSKQYWLWNYKKYYQFKKNILEKIIRYKMRKKGWLVSNKKNKYIFLYLILLDFYFNKVEGLFLNYSFEYLQNSLRNHNMYVLFLKKVSEFFLKKARKKNIRGLRFILSGRLRGRARKGKAYVTKGFIKHSAYFNKMHYTSYTGVTRYSSLTIKYLKTLYV